MMLAGCAGFPTPRDGLTFDDGLTADDLLERTVAAHGGDLRDYPGDFNLAMDGEWGRAIVRIQPVVTDVGYRIRAEERFRPSEGIYALRHEGPDGIKTVFRQGDELGLWYNGEADDDPVRRRATAMTTDAFQMFHFGPSFLLDRTVALERLADRREQGTTYRRILATIRPGFGEAEQDQVVLWIHPRTDLTWRMHITLNGFETTQGAHVDTTFLDYDEVGRFVFPSSFVERVRGPIRIRAHDWWITARDQDRGWSGADVRQPDFAGSAAAPAGAAGQE
ncbi:MAG: hypothetical protein EA370_14805 [Wenzhouxiangella sp.]|nr:MAG: hypothetical protein EA370_14805 [Wenzhouxiangella sp.]